MRKLTPVILILAGLLLGSGPVMANGTPAMIYGAGNLSCDTWSEGRRQPHNPAVSLARSWVLGFLSAMDGATHFISHDTKRLRSFDVNAVNGWLDNYCRANPRDYVALAAARLANQLDEQNR
jgi:hypothetical protein